MNPVKYLLLLFLFQISCNEPSDVSYREKIPPKAPDPREVKRLENEKMREKRRKRSVQRKPKSKQKLQEERAKLIAERKRRIARDSLIPSYRKTTHSENFDKIAKRYTGLNCSDSKWSDDILFDTAFRDSFEHSYAKTNLTDGWNFCLKDLDLCESSFSKLMFGRNEGGHQSDRVSIVTGQESTKSIYHLPLSYYYGIEGLETIMEAKIHGQIIQRKIEKRYGDSNTHPDSLKKQPRKVIQQEFSLDEFGEITKLSETIELYNIE